MPSHIVNFLNGETDQHAAALMPSIKVLIIKTCQTACQLHPMPFVKFLGSIQGYVCDLVEQRRMLRSLALTSPIPSHELSKALCSRNRFSAGWCQPGAQYLQT